jgi:hypothetical protein
MREGFEALSAHLESIDRKFDLYTQQHHSSHCELEDCIKKLTTIVDGHERRFQFAGWVWKGVAWVVASAGTLYGIWTSRT